MEKKLSFSERFKSSIRFFASLFASREFAVMYCIIGTLAEIAHMYYLTYSISALTGWFKVAQAIMLSGFISSSLLYFVLISDDRETVSDDEQIRTRAKKDSKRVNLAINIFTVINIAINFYYYCRHLIIDSVEWQLFDFVFAILVSCLLPVTIKLYANGIHVKDWSVSESPEIPDTKINTDKIKQEIISEIVDDINKDSREYIREFTVEQINEIQLPNKEQIRIAFEEQSKLFLNQFENRLKTLTNKNISIPKNDEPKRTSGGESAQQETKQSNQQLNDMVDIHNIVDDSRIITSGDMGGLDSNGDIPQNNPESETEEFRGISPSETTGFDRPIEPERPTESKQPVVGLSIDEYLKNMGQE